MTVVDYGLGNLRSVQRHLERAGARTTVTSDPDAVARAEKLVLPGVGHFGQAMHNLDERGLVPALREAALARRAPTLGICLGMQLMARRSEEGRAIGLGWIEADVVRFNIKDRLKLKVPHVGWNRAIVRRPSPLSARVAEGDEFYFAHAYHLVDAPTEIVVWETEYGYAFPSAVQQDNLFGVQLHPEKSYAAGDALIAGFLDA